MTWDELQVHDDDFADVVAAFDETASSARSARVGAADSRLLPVRPLVDFAAAWFAVHR